MKAISLLIETAIAWCRTLASWISVIKPHSTFSLGALPIDCFVDHRAKRQSLGFTQTDSFASTIIPLLCFRSGHTMFYVKTLEHEIVLQPVHFGSKLKATIVRLLKEEVEGLALANYGFVVNVIEVPEDQIKSGIIEYDSGDVVFTVKYTALLLRPFINEVLDATVSQCNQLGFFAYVGPLRIFVSKHSMPEDMFNGFDPDKDAWISDDKEVVISSGCGVRLKIKGRTVEQGNITAIGTIKDSYLGLVDDGEGGDQ